MTFVLCIENNAIRAQALLLCESIRAVRRPHRAGADPRRGAAPGLGVDRATRRAAGRDGRRVRRRAAQPSSVPQYGSANRVFAAAWAEARARSEWIVVLDSDTVFLDELALPADADVAVRPVDTKGQRDRQGPAIRSRTTGHGWRRLQGVSLDRLPFVRTTDGGHRVRASYNGGLVVVRTGRGILARGQISSPDRSRRA